MSNVPVSVHIDRPIEEVYDFLTTAANWPKWHPSTAAVFGAVLHPALEGEKIVEKVKAGIGIHELFTWTVVERERPTRWKISAVSQHGAKVDITYTLKKEGKGTLWLREMDFKIPKIFIPMEKLIFSPFVRWNSKVAVRQLKAVMESY
ncbi:MAG: SRPBCC family protein [Actinobacteria bacterium]|nr:SRPBCC family protein [Actinomycetota bacterium]